MPKSLIVQQYCLPRFYQNSTSATSISSGQWNQNNNLNVTHKNNTNDLKKYMMNMSILYHFDCRFSHMSQTTMNWTSTVFHSGSQAAVNFISNQDIVFSVPFRPFWEQNWTYFAFCHINFCLWTWSNSVHNCHRSHSVNLQLKWYSIWGLEGLVCRDRWMCVLIPFYILNTTNS
jgi:hypothetical protein